MDSTLQCTCNNGMVGESHDAVIGEKLYLSQSTSTDLMAYGAFKNLLVYSALGSIPARMLAPTLQLSNTLIKREKIQTRRGFNFKSRAQVRGGEGCLCVCVEGGDIVVDLHSDTAPTHVQFE
jgi:hypothetical protein